MRLIALGIFTVIAIQFKSQATLSLWEGDWKGQLSGYKDGAAIFTVNTQMSILKSIKCKNCWDWNTSYYKDSISEDLGVVIKDYWIEQDSIHLNHFTLFEPDPDAISIRYELFNQKLIGGYSILESDSLGMDDFSHQTIFHSEYTLNGDALSFRLTFYSYENENELDELASNVRSLIPLGYQEALLFRVKK